MQITYTGPFDAVDVPALGRTVTNGETITAPAAVGAALCTQDCWEPADDKPAKKAAAKKAAASETTAGDAG